MDFMIYLNPLLAPVKMLFEALAVAAKVLLVLPAPLGVLISFAIGVFLVRALVGLL